MIEPLVFALLIWLTVLAFVLGPVVLHPNLPRGRKWLLGVFVTLLLLAAAMLYAWLGAPHLSGL